jgi:hypothetical protein
MGVKLLSYVIVATLWSSPLPVSAGIQQFFLKNGGTGDVW